MKFTDYKHFMIVSAGTALMLQQDSNLDISMPEPVEDSPYPNSNLTFAGVYRIKNPDMFNSEYPDGYIHMAVYVDNYLQFVNAGGK